MAVANIITSTHVIKRQWLYPRVTISAEHAREPIRVYFINIPLPPPPPPAATCISHPLQAARARHFIQDEKSCALKTKMPSTLEVFIVTVLAETTSVSRGRTEANDADGLKTRLALAQMLRVHGVYPSTHEFGQVLDSLK
jgi:hypothetical protein